MKKNYHQVNFNSTQEQKEEAAKKLKSTITQRLLEKFKPNKDFLLIEGGFKKVDQKRAA